MKKSNLILHAERELKLAGLHKKDSDYSGMLYGAIMELVKVFSNQGHSGFSANRTIQLFKIVALYETLIPLTGKDSEWNEVSTRVFQNNRDSRVFKEKERMKPYFLDAIVWQSQDGSTWTGSTETKDKKVSSCQYIKSFPFTPKTFYVDVIEREVSKGHWEFTIKDEKQLEEVFEYYEEKR